MSEIFTIGHSSLKLDDLLQLLKTYKINCVIDVRSIPYSKYTPHFNRDNLKNFLNVNRIYYAFMGKELGARRKDKSLYSKEGYLDFEKVSENDLFNLGIQRIKDGIEKGFNVALMCTEKDPIDCHRNILVARKFYKLNYKVNNILINGQVESQDDIEKRLLDMYFPNRMQLTLFSDITTIDNDKELINEAYRLRNKDIGCSIIEEKGLVPSEIIYNRVY